MNGGLPLKTWKGLMVERGKSEKKQLTKRVFEIQKSQFKLSSFYPAHRKKREKTRNGFGQAETEEEENVHLYLLRACDMGRDKVGVDGVGLSEMSYYIFFIVHFLSTCISTAP
jgi:hypothetical protein